MLILNPRLVTFGTAPFRDVLALTIDREAKRLALEWSDLGPHATFADVPEQVAHVKLVQEVTDGSPDGPKPGDSATLSFVSSPTGADGDRTRWQSAAVVKSCTHDITTSGRSIGARRTVEFVLVSSNGSTDPISTTPVGPSGGEP